jgi:anti-sigma factor RsiW
MKQSPCDQLDDYILGWLSPDEAAAFERHLSDCITCHREHALQQSIDGLLSGTGGLLDAIPDGLIDRTRCRVQTARGRRAMRWVFSLTVAAAVLLLVIFGRFAVWPSNRTGDRNVAVSQNAATPPASTPANSTPDRFENLKASSRVVLADPSSGIVVDCKTRDPRINIVWIYPTVKPVAISDDQHNE